MRKFIVAALLAGTVATPALAQDVVPVAAGTGPRIEGIIGFEDTSETGTDLIYGVGAGFDFTALGATAGIEAEYMDTDGKQCERDVVAVGDKVCAGLGRDIYVGGRIGANLFGSSFVYVKGGYTNQRVRASFDDGGTGQFNTSANEDLDGARVGAGVEFGIPTLGFGSAAYVKTEYRYSNYEQGFDKHQGVVGVGFRF